MTYYAIAALLNGIGSTLLGLAVYFNSMRRRVNKGFALFCLCVSVWSFSYFLWQISKDETMALFWSRALMAGAIFVPATYLHFVLALLDQLPKRKTFLIFSYALFSIFFILDFTPLFVATVQPELSFRFWPKPGIAYHFFLVIWFVYMLYCIWLLSADYLKSERVKKTQVKYVLLGVVFALLGASTNYFLWYGIHIPPVGNILVLAYIGFTAYAILEYQLMQVRVVATEVFAALIPVVLLVDVLFSKNQMEAIWKGVIFLMVSFFAFLIIRGVLKEIKSKEELEKLDKAKVEFLNLASHQLRSPTSVIKGIASMMKEGDFDKLTKEKKKIFIDAIFEKSCKLESTISDILNASELTSEGFKIKPEDATRIDPVALVEKIVKDFEPKLLERQIDLKINAPPEALLSIFGQERFLKEVLSNLVDNAIKYTPPTKEDHKTKDISRVKAEIKINVFCDKDNIVFEIIDHGIGIPSNEISNLFKKFQRASNARAMYTDGSGLGLFIAKEIIEGHAGSIAVESELNKGTKVSVRLPLNQGRPPNIKQYIINKQATT